jgi:plastocyanin
VRIKALALPGLAAVVVAALALSLGHHGRFAVRAKANTTVIAKTRDLTIAIRAFAYSPAAVTVKAGTRVTWTNHDATAHTATADQGAFDTGTINPGKSHTIDLKRSGTYPYHCSFHAFMTATIKVVG